MPVQFVTKRIKFEVVFQGLPDESAYSDVCFEAEFFQDGFLSVGEGDGIFAGLGFIFFGFGIPVDCVLVDWPVEIDGLLLNHAASILPSIIDATVSGDSSKNMAGSIFRSLPHFFARSRDNPRLPFK